MSHSTKVNGLLTPVLASKMAGPPRKTVETPPPKSMNKENMKKINSCSADSRQKDEVYKENKEDIDEFDDFYSKDLNKNASELESEMEAMKQQFDKIKQSNLATPIKIQLMYSVRDTLRTKMKLIENSNKQFKERIINFEKIHDYTTNLDLIKHGNLKKSPPPELIQQSPEEFNKQKLLKHGLLGSDDPKTCTSSFVSSQSTADSYLDENKEIETIIQDHKRLEETIVVLKTNRNNLALTIDDLKDEVCQLKMIVDEKNQILQSKVRHLEELTKRISKAKIATSTARHASVVGRGDSSRGTQQRGSGSLTSRPGYQDLNSSKMNSSFFVEVGSSLKHYVSSKFFNRKKSTPNGNILDNEILSDLNLGKS
jgi:DNA repair exonuclease SbcCD ATPase subunit